MPENSSITTFEELKQAAIHVCQAEGVADHAQGIIAQINAIESGGAPAPEQTFADVEHVLEAIVPGNELQAYEFLEAATCTIINEPIREVVVQAIRVRKKWRRIKDEYQELREADALKEDAVRRLSRKYHYSVKTIETIIYER